MWTSRWNNTVFHHLFWEVLRFSIDCITLYNHLRCINTCWCCIGYTKLIRYICRICFCVLSTINNSCLICVIWIGICPYCFRECQIRRRSLIAPCPYCTVFLNCNRLIWTACYLHCIFKYLNRQVATIVSSVTKLTVCTITPCEQVTVFCDNCGMLATCWNCCYLLQVVISICTGIICWIVFNVKCLYTGFYLYRIILLIWLFIFNLQIIAIIPTNAGSIYISSLIWRCSIGNCRTITRLSFIILTPSVSSTVFLQCDCEIATGSDVDYIFKITVTFYTTYFYRCKH